MTIDFTRSRGTSFNIPSEGLYVARFLDHVSAQKLIQFVAQTKVCQLSTEDVNDFHSTVIHSELKPPQEEEVNTFSATAAVTEIQHWDGHDNTGYLVALLNSAGLHKSYNIWVQRGCGSKFPNYLPHITLKTPFPRSEINQARLDKANVLLGKNPIQLNLPVELMFVLKNRQTAKASLKTQRRQAYIKEMSRQHVTN